MNPSQDLQEVENGLLVTQFNSSPDSNNLNHIAKIKQLSEYKKTVFRIGIININSIPKISKETKKHRRYLTKIQL